jgi:hypothetical protein
MFCARGPMKTSARIRKIFSNGRPGARREEGTPELVPMTTPFTLDPPEVDFVLVSCLAGIILFVRL